MFIFGVFYLHNAERWEHEGPPEVTGRHPNEYRGEFNRGLHTRSNVRPVMEKRYDLFELPPGGFPQWIDSASDLSEAKKKMSDLPEPAPGGEYLVRDFYSGLVVAYTVPNRRGVATFPPVSRRRAAGAA